MAARERVIVGSDHAGFELKEFVKSELTAMGIEVEDAGSVTLDPADDYPLSAGAVARAVDAGRYTRGIAVCGTGIGASMAANKFRRVRAALCLTPEMAHLARAHNDANVLVLGGRITPQDTASRILRVWLETPFEGGRHKRRVDQIESLGG